MEQNQTPPPAIRYDRGHQGDIDYTLLDVMLALTPTERLVKHERWRLFVKEALKNAALRERTNSAVG
ncbi:MAG: hypothetical protein HYS12_14085 [Planctomycetes bacterium]|nr:hypothetical protein [Planctomycetota bacterium]